MNITTVQWNIGGGKILQDGQDPLLMASYNQDGMDHILGFLRSVSPDIVTLQEVHADDHLNQAELIAKKLQLEYCISDFNADSHIEEGQRLGHAIISRYPITNQFFELYVNLNKQVIGEDGRLWKMHDKGYTRCTINVDGTPIEVTTTHLIPMRRFGVDYTSDEGRYVLDDVQKKLASPGDRQLIQADFNLDLALLEPALPNLITNGLSEVRQDAVTTPNGRRYDHVLYKGLDLIKSSVDNTVLTDHYPITTTLSL